ncbi:MAG: hypothetical protein M1834_008454 [Cirrosporium novae-zelandiae]|nr:MAG: hypothetical protein M1834_008454 [Cirrosporium novae-zelandiae]
MAPSIFITGATGYIGGDALHAIYTQHPGYSYTALVRTEEKGRQVKALYPSIRLVYGDLNDSSLLKEECSKADIVIHTADSSDNVPAAKAIAAGLIAGHSSSHPGFWLHTGGTGILSFEDSKKGVYGEENKKVFNDLTGINELITLPDDAFHRDVDKIVLETGTKHAEVVKTALVCPPTIYGKVSVRFAMKSTNEHEGVGRGPCSKRGRQVYELANTTLKQKQAPIIGAGKSRWNNLHIHDLGDLYCLLVDAAVSGNTNPEAWGAHGYYLAENGEHMWGEVSKAMAECAAELGYIPSAQVAPMDVDRARELLGFEAVSWGLNSRAKAERARLILGWKPSRPSLNEEIPVMVKGEWERLRAGIETTAKYYGK